jgi:hypothetical protein
MKTIAVSTANTDSCIDRSAEGFPASVGATDGYTGSTDTREAYWLDVCSSRRIQSTSRSLHPFTRTQPPDVSSPGL